MQSKDIIIKLSLVAMAILFLSCKPTQQDNIASISQEQKTQEKTVAGVASGFDCAVVSVLCPSTHRAADSPPDFSLTTRIFIS